MNGAFEIAGIGLAAEQKALDVIANNIANINTPAFKRSDIQFSEMLAQQADPTNPRADLSADPGLAGVSANAVLRLDQPGQIEQTGQTLDLAIDGDGFIELLGPHGQPLLWRGGTLTINADGQLSGANGYALRAEINVPEGASALTIDADGTVSALLAGAQQPTQLGKITLVTPDDPASLDRLDNGLYRAPDDARLAEAMPQQDGMGALVQGALEHSNVEINDEMVQLMIVQRAYGANAEIVQAADQMMGIANGLRR